MGEMGQWEDKEPPAFLWPEQTLCGCQLPWCCPCLSCHFWWGCFEKLAVASWSSAPRDPHVRVSEGGPLLSRGRVYVCCGRTGRKPGLGP